MAKRVNIAAHPSQLSLEKVDSNVLLELFPFAIILDENMHIKRCGEKLLETWIVQNPHKKPEKFYNSVVTEYFKLRRPKGITFNWKTVTLMHTVIFELELIRSTAGDEQLYDDDDDDDMPASANDAISVDTQKLSLEEVAEENALVAAISTDAAKQRGAQNNYRLLLKGQMRYIADLDSIVFLCSPLYVFYEYIDYFKTKHTIR